MHAGTVAQIHTDVVQARYARIQRLAEVARDNAPDPRYVDNFRKNSQVGNPPFLTERQREKVVKYINEVRHRKLPTHNVRVAKSQTGAIPPGGDAYLLISTRSCCVCSWRRTLS